MGLWEITCASVIFKLSDDKICGSIYSISNAIAGCIGAAYFIESGILTDHGYLDVAFYIIMIITAPAMIFLFIHHMTAPKLDLSEPGVD